MEQLIRDFDASFNILVRDWHVFYTIKRVFTLEFQRAINSYKIKTLGEAQVKYKIR